MADDPAALSLDDYLKQQRATQTQQTDDASKAWLSGPDAATLSGLTFGFGDELTAGARSLVTPTSYSDALAQERASRADYAKTNPGSSALGELVGGLPWIIATRGTGLPAISGLPRIAQPLINAAGLGAIYGGAQGAGEGEGVGDRLAKAATGAALGGGLGAVTAPIAMGLGAGANYLRRAIGPLTEGGATRAAEEAAVKGFDRMPDGVSGATRRLTDYAADEADRAAAGFRSPGRTVAEVAGDQPVGQLETILQQPGTGASTVGNMLKDRAAGRLERVQQAFRRTFGAETSAFNERQAAYAERRAGAQPLYDQAFSLAPELTQADLDLIQRAGPTAIKDAQDIARSQGTRLSFTPRYDENGNLILRAGESLPTAQDMHIIKQGVQNVIDKETRADRQLTTYGGNMVGVRNDMVDRLNAMTIDPATGQSVYQQATNAWAGPSGRIRAMQLGHDALTTDLDELRAEVQRMTPEQRDAFAQGYMHDIADRLSKVDITGTASPVRAVFRTPKDEATAHIALGALGLTPEESAARWARLETAMGQEVQGVQGERHMMQGSPTVRRQLGAKDLTVPAIGTGAGVTTWMMSGNPVLTAAATLGPSLLARAGRAVQTTGEEKTRNALAVLLGGTTQADQSAALAAIQARARALAATRLAYPSAQASGVVTAAGGQQAGSQVGQNRPIPPMLDPRYFSP